MHFLRPLPGVVLARNYRICNWLTSVGRLALFVQICPCAADPFPVGVRPCIGMKAQWHSTLDDGLRNAPKSVQQKSLFLRRGDGKYRPAEASPDSRPTPQRQDTCLQREPLRRRDAEITAGVDPDHLLSNLLAAASPFRMVLMRVVTRLASSCTWLVPMHHTFLQRSSTARWECRPDSGVGITLKVSTR